MLAALGAGNPCTDARVNGDHSSHRHGNIGQCRSNHRSAMCCRQVAPRHQVVQTADSTEAGFALFAFCPDLPSRTAVNSHIVVAGASDTGLSVIETLLLHERLHFTAATLLAPTGVVTPPPDAHYTAGLLQRLVSLSSSYHNFIYRVRGLKFLGIQHSLS